MQTGNKHSSKSGERGDHEEEAPWCGIELADDGNANLGVCSLPACYRHVTYRTAHKIEIRKTKRLCGGLFWSRKKTKSQVCDIVYV